MHETRDKTKKDIGLITHIAVLFVINALLSSGCTNLMLHHIHVRDLEAERYEVIGHLGVPLGWTVRAEVVVVDGDCTEEKEYSGTYLLDIVSINWKKLKNPLLMEFSDRSYRMPSNVFDRIKDVDGYSSGLVDEDIKARVNMGYVGNKYDVLIFEEGAFSGFISPCYPIHFPVWQGNVRGLKTSICILQVYGVNEGIRATQSPRYVPNPSVMVKIPMGVNSGNDPDFGAYSLTNASAFYMGSAEVMKADWDKMYAWALRHGYSFDNSGSGRTSHHPVNKVNWFDCVKWCNARSEKEGKSPCYTTSGEVYRSGQIVPDCNFSVNGYRLPTMKEWEYAARGGLSGKRFPWGDTITQRQANYYNGRSVKYDVSMTEGFHPDYYEETDDDNQDFTSPVGSFAANGFGLYDMAGNVWEWCWDSFGMSRQMRGGSWADPADNLRCGEGINWWDPSEALVFIGFRCVRR